LLSCTSFFLAAPLVDLKHPFLSLVTYRYDGSEGRSFSGSLVVAATTFFAAIMCKGTFLGTPYSKYNCYTFCLFFWFSFQADNNPGLGLTGIFKLD